MLNKIGFIAIGQMGGNIGSLLEKENVNGLFINSSKEDLDTLHVKNKYHIKDGEGCAKNRKLSKQLFKDDIENILKEINKVIDKEIIFVIGSSSGGTGSGALPLISDYISTATNKTVCVITTLPNNKESVQAKINTIDMFKELSQVNKIGATLIIDNNKNSNVIELNHKFISVFKNFLNIHSETNISGNIDQREIHQLLKSNGVLSIKNMDKGIIKEQYIVKNIKSNNILADIEDDKEIKYLLYSGSKAILDEQYMKNELGSYIDSYKCNNRKTNLIALSGLTLPYKRLEEIQEAVNVFEKDFQSKNEESKIKLENLFGNTTSLNFFGEDEKEKTEDIDLENSIFAKYLK